MPARHTLRRQLEDLRAYIASHPWAMSISSFSFVLVLLMVALPLWKLLPIVKNNPYIPLHYNIYLGIDRFGSWYEVFTLPVIGFVILILNLSLAAAFSEVESRVFRLGKSEPVLSRLVLWLTPVLEVILFAGVVFLLLLNI